MKRFEDIKLILYDERLRDSVLVQKCNKFFSQGDKNVIVYRTADEFNSIVNRLRVNGYHSKDVLILVDFKGRFIQRCPGSPGMICCNYYILNTCLNCLFNCSYCYLNAYLNTFGIMQFVNVDEMRDEYLQFLANCPTDIFVRIGTGEFTDSLMIDDVTELGRELIAISNARENVILELKTKSNNIDHLIDIEPKGNTVLAWSINTERNALRYEKDCASIHERIEAARMAVSAGYHIAFHFDPIIIYPGWEEEYRDLIHTLFTAVDTEKIAWISMGCFRYSSGFKEICRDFAHGGELFVEEMFPGQDGKFRYLKKKRIAVYKKIKEFIELYTHIPFLYMCMESRDVWGAVFDRAYRSSRDLELDFSNHISRIFSR